MSTLLTASVVACAAGAGWALIDAHRRADAREVAVAVLLALAALSSAVALFQRSGTEQTANRWFFDAAGPAVLLSAVAALVALWVSRAGARNAAQRQAGAVGDREALRQAEHRQNVLLNAPLDSMVLMETDGTILQLNQTAADRLDASVDDLLGRCIYDWIPPDVARSRKETVREVVRSASAVRIEDRRNGFVFESSVHPVFDREGKVIQIAICARDITDRKKAEEERRTLEAKLRQAQKLEALGTLATGVAHECNNMLMAITSANDLAQKRLSETDPARPPLKTIEQACRQAGEVMRSLLTFARKHQSQAEPVELGRLIESFTVLLRPLLPASIELRHDLAEADPIWVRGDANQLKQVLMNLALNARDAMPKGGTLTVSLRRTSPRSGQDDSRMAALIVQDTGVGISDEVRDRIFEPFYSSKPRDQGAGLGLSVVFGIVSDHGGEIVAESEPHRGARFVVRLPMCDPPMEKAAGRRS